MDDYFKRQIELWGADTQQLLRDKKIAIIGAGGLGSSLSFALGGIGIGKIEIIDFDDVSLHNIHRQIAFKMGDEGKNKADVNAQLIQQRSPYTKATPFQCDFKEWSKKNTDIDLIIDATDNIQTRVDINNYAKSRNIPWIYGSVEAFYGQVSLLYDSSFDDIFKVKSHKPLGIAAPMVMHIASLQANLAIRFLAGLSIKKDILYYLYFDNDGELVTQKFNLPK